MIAIVFLIVALLAPSVKSSLDSYLDRMYPRRFKQDGQMMKYSIDGFHTEIAWKPISCQLSNYRFTIVDFIERTKWTDAYIVYDSNSQQNYTLTRYPRIIDFTSILQFYAVAKHSSITKPLCHWPKGVPGIVTNINPSLWKSLGQHLAEKINISTNYTRLDPARRSPAFNIESKAIMSQMLNLIEYVHRIGFSFRYKSIPTWVTVHETILRLHPSRVIFLPLCRRLIPMYSKSNFIDFFPSIPKFNFMRDKVVDIYDYFNSNSDSVKSQVKFPHDKFDMFSINMFDSNSSASLELESTSLEVQNMCEIGHELNSFVVLADMIAIHVILPMYKVEKNVFISYDYELGYFYSNDQGNDEPLSSFILKSIREAGHIVDKSIDTLVSYLLHLSSDYSTRTKLRCPSTITQCISEEFTNDVLNELKNMSFWHQTN